MSPKASETGFFGALKDDDTEDEVPRRRRAKDTPAPDAAPEEQAPAAAQDGDQPLPQMPSAPRRRRPEPVHKISVDVHLSLVDGLAELYERDRRGPKAEINEAIRNHLKKKNITVQPWEG